MSFWTSPTRLPKVMERPANTMRMVTNAGSADDARVPIRMRRAAAAILGTVAMNVVVVFEAPS